jgi:HSP20 family molecular chaperone IbpA
MANIMVHRADSGRAAVANPFFAKVEAELEAVRRRAYELFEARGCTPGSDMEDWLQAERELFFVPQAEITETPNGIKITIEAKGFDTKDFEVIALPREVLVEAKHEKIAHNGHKGSKDETFETKCLYRRFELATPININKVKATIDHGELRIEAPRETLQPVPVRAAAA